MKRASGVLMHISSLPNKFGIGSFGQSAYDFVDFLVDTKQTYWQILPLTTTSYGDSPYQSFSAFAGNTHFIDFERLFDKGLLAKSDYETVNFGDDPETVDYARIFDRRRPILDKAVNSFKRSGFNKEYQAFVKKNKKWLEPFAQYMTVKEQNELNAWYEWEDEFRNYDPEKISNFCEDHEDTMIYHYVTQYFFHEQWFELKDYANKNDILIIGDLPIYIARDSAEMWTTPELFKVDDYNNPQTVAGVPPDGFTDEGQFWGNPIYDWEYMKETDYAWWAWRLEASFDLYDIVRIDHFRGFESYWEVPFGAKTAAEGHWSPGPSSDLFDSLKEQLGNMPIIAEDLGYMTDEVIAMREKTGFPGMHIMQFGFNGVEDSLDLPHHFRKNSVAYIGTHDNMTGLGWYKDAANQDQRDQMDLYLNRKPGELITQALHRGLAGCVCDTVIYTMQDLLNLDNRARMNIPSTVGGNWQWRMLEDAITPDVSDHLTQLTETYFRV